MDEIILSSLTSKCVLSKQPEGLVYLIDSPYEGGKKVVVKSRNVSMKHEYKVGLALNEFIKAHELGRYFVKTLDYFERNEKTYLVTEYAAGESPTEENIKEVAGELFYVLQELQYTLRFTHYGLYLGNYIAFKRETPVEINLPHLGKRFESTYSIKIIDYGYSHFGGTLDESIPAVEVTTVETNLYRLTLGKIPTIHDPFYDLVNLIAVVRFYNKPKSADPIKSCLRLDHFVLRYQEVFIPKTRYAIPFLDCFAESVIDFTDTSTFLSDDEFILEIEQIVDSFKTMLFTPDALNKILDSSDFHKKALPYLIRWLTCKKLERMNERRHQSVIIDTFSNQLSNL